ncbi:YpjP family protein [Sporolactobacillus shoreicorticis]|uniref:YpjP family protein n=1 Tax=Sporolactobacillus shoreicorticis TaxID=1923877 RepID=A0ABW5S9C8_9BACL|nr:YpjP family protein [Sporolactobacillus shoreicorticis]MCO7127295.1 YpjP family protein [Sporolactobacillus shoreicorticis]
MAKFGLEVGFVIPQWIKKSLVACVAVLTFGTVVPTLPAHYLDKENDKQNVQKTGNDVSSPSFEAKSSAKEESRYSWKLNVSKEDLIDGFSSYAVQEAEKQGTAKFGSRITERINPQYRNQIIPAFAQAVHEISDVHSNAWIRELDVTHSPAQGLGERIMHVYNRQSGKEVLKLHVRRDHPPLDGYYFNFHYHTALDDFQQHHEIKTIYWGKNMPPKWRA